MAHDPMKDWVLVDNNQSLEKIEVLGGYLYRSRMNGTVSAPVFVPFTVLGAGIV